MVAIFEEKEIEKCTKNSHVCVILKQLLLLPTKHPSFSFPDVAKARWQGFDQCSELFCVVYFACLHSCTIHIDKENKHLVPEIKGVPVEDRGVEVIKWLY